MREKKQLIHSIRESDNIPMKVITLVYYGLSLNVESLSGNMYTNNAINGFVELLSYVMCMFCLNRIGRRWMTSGLMIIGGVACLSALVLNEYGIKENTVWMLQLSKWLSFTGKFAISGAFCVIFIYAAELYPTEVRTIGIGFTSGIGRIGGIIAPFIIMLQDTNGLSYVPYLIFGLLAIVSGVCTLALPETTGKPILQTIEEAESLFGSTLPQTDTVIINHNLQNKIR